MPSQSTNKLITDKVITVGFGIIGSVITAILLWIGSTVQKVQVDMARVATTIDQQVMINSDVKTTLNSHAVRLDTVEIKLMKIERKY